MGFVLDVPGPARNNDPKEQGDPNSGIVHDYKMTVLSRMPIERNDVYNKLGLSLRLVESVQYITVDW